MSKDKIELLINLASFIATLGYYVFRINQATTAVRLQKLGQKIDDGQRTFLAAFRDKDIDNMKKCLESHKSDLLEFIELLDGNTGLFESKSVDTIKELIRKQCHLMEVVSKSADLEFNLTDEEKAVFKLLSYSRKSGAVKTLVGLYKGFTKPTITYVPAKGH